MTFVNKLTLFTLLLLLSCSCNQDKSTEKSELLKLADSNSYPVITLGQLENETWIFFQELESEIKRQEKNINENEINEQIQYMIDKKLVNEPLIILETEKGTEFKSVDYLTYKNYRLKNPIDTNRLFTTGSKITKEDSLRFKEQDSLRKDLIKILNGNN